MLLGWGVLAVPTGIVTAEMTMHHQRRHSQQRMCPNCGVALDGSTAVVHMEVRPQ